MMYYNKYNEERNFIMKEKKTIAILTAAGTGTRTGQDIPKQFLHIENKPLIIYTLEAFEKHPSVDVIIVVCLEGWFDILNAYAKQFNLTKLKHIVAGGKTGQESIKNGVFEAAKYYTDDSIVIVHDGNRGLVSQDIISNALSTYNEYGNAVTAIPCVEAVYESEDKGLTSTTEIPREKLFRTQTPHIWSLEKMVWAHNQAAKKKITNMTATCSLMKELGEVIHFSKGSEKNMKVTTVEDIELFTAILHSNIDSWIKR